MNGLRRAGAAAAVLLALTGAIPAAQAPPDAGWRTATLASFDDIWQTVHDTFFDPAFGGVDWSAAREELRPKVEHAASPEAAREAMTDLLRRLKQSHFVLLSAAAADEDTLPGEATVLVDVRVAAGLPVITSVNAAGDDAAGRGLRSGQAIVAIDGASIAALPGRVPDGDARARDFAIWRKVFRALHGADGSRATLRVADPAGVEHDARVVRRVEPGSRIQFGNLPPLRIRFEARALRTPAGRGAGLITFNLWMTTIDGPVADAVDRFRADAGIVVDLRGNPGGLAGMIRGVAGQFLAEPALLGTSRTREAALEFSANPRRVTAAGRRVEPYAGPVALLVDELTGSTSECFVAALQALGRARVFGRQTMGQALPALTKRLPDGDVFMYAVGDFVAPNGRRVEGDGIRPDDVVALNREDLWAGKDDVLASALRWIDQAPRSGRK